MAQALRVADDACMTARVVELKDGPKMVAELKGEMREAAMRGLISAAHRLRAQIVAKIVPSRSPKPVDRGIFRAGWMSYATTIEGQECAVVENTVPHAAFIEYGVPATNVKPGKAMIDALTEWVIRKRIVNKSKASAARGVAIAIAHKLKMRGIFNGGQGLRILEEAMREADKVIDAEIAAELKRL